MEKMEPSYTVGRNLNWYSHYGEQYGGSLKKLKIVYYMIQKFYLWAYIWKRQKLIQTNTCTPMFIVTLFTIAETWKQCKCSLTDEQDKENVICIYHGILLSHRKKLKPAICSNMNRPRDYHTKNKVIQIYDITYMWNLNK